ncbi:hypothetical protein QR680_014117 [Steinernema hermaphroditum]|uniref:DUSP domain-containing protein n=1 Tax=Steinernema hermaphroditum TaxID=289476 RepID=A0AA39I949_9BILA|nr:hypothetical protein QR680_014117 [Steinernema hermaphroditum]
MLPELLVLLAASTSVLEYRKFKSDDNDVTCNITLLIEISKCRHSALNGDLLPSVGFVDEDTDILLWKIDLPRALATRDDTKQVNVAFVADAATVAHIEHVCYEWAEEKKAREAKEAKEAKEEEENKEYEEEDEDKEDEEGKESKESKENEEDKNDNEDKEGKKNEEDKEEKEEKQGNEDNEDKENNEDKDSNEDKESKENEEDKKDNEDKEGKKNEEAKKDNEVIVEKDPYVQCFIPNIINLQKAEGWPIGMTWKPTWLTMWITYLKKKEEEGKEGKDKEGGKKNEEDKAEKEGYEVLVTEHVSFGPYDRCDTYIIRATQNDTYIVNHPKTGDKFLPSNHFRVGGRYP